MQTAFLIEFGVSFSKLDRGTHTCVWGQFDRSCVSTISRLWDDSEAVSAARDQSSDTDCSTLDHFRPKNGVIGCLHHIRVVGFALQLLPRQVHSVCGGLFLCEVVDWIRTWENETFVFLILETTELNPRKQSQTPAGSIKLTGVVFSNHSYALIVRHSQCSNRDVVKTSRLELV